VVPRVKHILIYDQRVGLIIDRSERARQPQVRDQPRPIEDDAEAAPSELDVPYDEGASDRKREVVEEDRVVRTLANLVAEHVDKMGEKFGKIVLPVFNRQQKFGTELIFHIDLSDASQRGTEVPKPIRKVWVRATGKVHVAINDWELSLIGLHARQMVK
jgi:hypothetical protein